jgi:hypothetical protein
MPSNHVHEAALQPCPDRSLREKDSEEVEQRIFTSTYIMVVLECAPDVVCSDGPVEGAKREQADVVRTNLVDRTDYNERERCMSASALFGSRY